MGRETTQDEINLDLDGTIDAAIKKLQKLKKQHPDGRLNLTSDYEYGESYPRLKLEFTRSKEPIEIEYDKWREKQRKFCELASASRTFAAEGLPYPRETELAALKEELGCFAEGGMSRLLIYGDEIISEVPMVGGRTRDGTWVYRYMGSEGFDSFLKEHEIIE